MNKTSVYILLMSITCYFLYSCNIYKNIPEGQYLVDKVDLDIDNKKVKEDELSSYIRQKPNDPKIRVGIYYWALDSSNWFKRTIGKLGQAPVIYSDNSTQQSVNQISTELENRGYWNAEVTSAVDTTDKKAKIHYRVITHDPYRIRNYNIRIHENERVDSLLERRKRRNRTRIKPDIIFDMYTLQDEMNDVSEILRNRGYYTSVPNNLHYLADTTPDVNKVNLTMILKDSVRLEPYRLRKVSVFSGYDPLNRRGYRIADSLHTDGLDVYYDRTHFLRPSVFRSNILLRPGQLFSERRTDLTYSYLSALRSVSRANIEFNEIYEGDSAFLDCNIYLTPGKVHGIQTGIEGTNKAGDLGIAANVTYSHQNIFNGSEVLNIRLRGAYEFVSNNSSNVLNHNFYEVGLGAGLWFPKIHVPVIGTLGRQKYRTSSEYSISFTLQRRPEFTRNFFNFTWKNNWQNLQGTIIQTLNLLDINYVFMPWKSDRFNDYLNEEVNSITRYSYDNVFIAGIGYNIVLTNDNRSVRMRRTFHTIRLGVESSGNLLYGIFSLVHAKKNDAGQYNIAGNPFAQFVKTDMEFAQTHRLNARWSLAYHALLGLAYPYANSSILPFEKRYYGGGPNSIRGWSTRHLGPGSYNGEISNPTTHVGDIRFELSAEYRYKWIKWLEPAVFVDAGNIWTIKEYENQPNGMFRFSKFYKEMAVATGIGIRFDLDFLVLRLDGGKKVYDPAKRGKDRWVLFDKFGGNSALHFAIGYPF